MCLRPKRFLRTTNQTPEYYHVAYVTNRVLQHGLNHHRQLPSHCYSTWQQTHVDILPVNQHWEDDTGFQCSFTVFWQQRDCGRTNSIPLGKKLPWNPGEKYTVVGTGSCPQMYLPRPISSSFSFPGLLIIASLWATQVNFPFLKLLIQAQQPWPSGPSLITLQPSAEYRFSFCIKYYQLLVLLCPVSSLSFLCLFLLRCWKSASCPPCIQFRHFPLWGCLGPDRRPWALSRGSCTLQSLSVLISECAASGLDVVVGRDLGMHHTPACTTFLWMKIQLCSQHRSCGTPQWLLQPVGVHVACCLDRQRKHKDSLLVLLCGVQRHHSLQQLRPVIMNTILLLNRVLSQLTEFSGTSHKKQGAPVEPI